MWEALRHLTMAECSNKEEKLELLSNRIILIEKFVEGRNNIKSNPKMMLDICNQLLINPDIDTAVRVGDIYA